MGRLGSSTAFFFIFFLLSFPPLFNCLYILYLYLAPRLMSVCDEGYKTYYYLQLAPQSGSAKGRYLAGSSLCSLVDHCLPPACLLLPAGRDIDPHVYNMSSTVETYPGDDEDFITRLLPQKLGKQSAAVSEALAVHFSFFMQVRLGSTRV